MDRLLVQMKWRQEMKSENPYNKINVTFGVAPVQSEMKLDDVPDGFFTGRFCNATGLFIRVGEMIAFLGPTNEAVTEFGFDRFMFVKWRVSSHGEIVYEYKSVDVEILVK